MYQQMAGCADGKELQISDSPYTWKFQPPESRHAIAATPSPFISTKSPSAALPPPYFWTCFQQTASKYTNPESAAATTEPQPYKREPHDNWVSSRWNPTPEQLQSLEELYRSGVRTPTAKQIQQIAAKLRRFGKIEGKNVFYWFQNHKSSERLKHHRRINLGLKKQRSVQKQSGLTRTDFIVGQANYWASLSTSATSSEESVSLQSAVIAEGNRGIGIKREERERELGQSSSDSRKQQTVNIWQKIEMTDPATTCTTAPVTLLQEVARSQKFSTETQLCNILLKPKHDNAFNQDLLEDERRRESHTLQLFPSPFNDVNIPNVVKKDEAELPILTVNTNLAPIEFYELFPLNSKNKKI